MNVVLQAGALMISGEVYLAAGEKKAAVNEFDDSIGKIAGKIGAVVGCSVFAEAARDEDLGKPVGERELDVGIGFVVAEKNIEARLALLDEIVFKRESFVLVGDEDVLEIDGFAHERAGFGVGLGSFEQVGTDPRAEILGLAHINDFVFGVFVEIHAGLRGKGPNFLEEVH